MNSGQAKGLKSKDTDLLKKIEALRTRLLADGEVQQKIGLRAYELYERRGGEHGHDLEDWIEAENEILSPRIEQELKGAAETKVTRRQEGETAESPTHGEEAIEVWEGEGGALPPLHLGVAGADATGFFLRG
jgi:hypothetical protein